MKRKLSKEEKDQCQKGIARLEKDLPYEDYLIDHANLMLNTGLKVNYDRQMKEFGIKKKQSEENKKQMLSTISVLNEQVRHGVEQKQKVK